jgi:hypothetical protein
MLKMSPINWILMTKNLGVSFKGHLVKDPM